MRAITVDTVNRDGTSQARVTPAQIETLRAQLRAAGDRWVVVLSHNRLPDEALAALDAAPARRRRDLRQLASQPDPRRAAATG